MKITQTRIRQIIREELAILLKEEAPELNQKGKTLDGEALPAVRLVGPKGLGGVAKGGQNVIVGPGWPGTPPDQFQLYVLPPGKVIGHYASIKDALKNAMTGEGYYASGKEILANSMADTAQPGSARDSVVTQKI